jgi:hypothetical protein
MKRAIRFEKPNSQDIPLNFAKSWFDTVGEVFINENQLEEFSQLIEYLNNCENLESLLDQINERMEK